MIQEYGSLAEKFLKKGFWLYLFSFIIAPIGYIIKIIISGELSVSEVGILYGIISLIILVGSYNDLGMSESLKHFVPKFLAKKEYQKIKMILIIAFFIQIFTACIITMIFYFGSDFLSLYYFKDPQASEALKIFAFFFLGLNILQTLGNFFISVQDTFYAKIIDLVRMLGALLMVLFLFFSDLSTLVNFSMAQVVGVYLGCLIAISSFYILYYKKYLRGVPINFKKSELQPIFSYALLVIIGASAGTILSQIDMQMIIFLLGTTDAGYYTNYLSIIGIPFMIIGPIFALLFPVIAELHGKGDTQKIAGIKKIFSDVFISVGIMFNVFFFIFAEAIAFTLFGEKFINSGIILQYSILFLTFNFLLQINFNLQAGIGNIKSNVQITIAAMILNIITNIIFIQFIGVYGAALATGLGWIFMWLLSQRAIKSEYKSQLNIANLLKNIVIFGLAGIVLYFTTVKFLSSETRFMNFMFLGLLFAVWLGIFIITNHKMFQSFIGEIKKIKRKTG